MLFELLNLHLWQAIHCTLDKPALVTATADSIQHIEQWTLHTVHLYYMLRIYHFAIQISEICHSDSEDLHGEMKPYLTAPPC